MSLGWLGRFGDIGPKGHIRTVPVFDADGKPVGGSVEANRSRNSLACKHKSPGSNTWAFLIDPNFIRVIRVFRGSRLGEH